MQTPDCMWFDREKMIKGVCVCLCVGGGGDNGVPPPAFGFKMVEK